MRSPLSTARAAALGFLAILAIMLPFAAIGIAAGVFEPAMRRVPDIEPWLVFELAGGAVACMLGGAMSARLGTHLAAQWLAAGVFAVALVEGLLVTSLGGELSRPWLPYLVPFVGAGGVLVGARLGTRNGTRPGPPRRTAVPWQLWIAPVAAAALLLATRLAPDLPAVRRAVGVVAVLAELGLVSFVAYAVVRTLRKPGARHGDALDTIRRVAGSVAGDTVAAGIIATELGILHSAFTFRRAPGTQVPTFTHHEELGYGAVAAAFSAIIVIETVVVHLMLRAWSPTVAWILTGLSLYGLLWLLGDYRAMRRRATSLSATTLAIRLGLRWELDVPLSAVERVEIVNDRAAPGTADLRVSPLRTSNVRLILSAPVDARGMYGIKRHASTIWLQLDQAAAFVAIVRAQRAAMEHASSEPHGEVARASG